MNYNLGNTIYVGVNAEVLLDGVVQKYCVEADTTEGFVIRYKMRDDGHFAIEGDEFVTEKVIGVVSVSLKELWDSEGHCVWRGRLRNI